MSERQEMSSLQIPEWILLNNQIVDEEGRIKDLTKDKDAAHSYFINEINKKTQFFHSLEEKLIIWLKMITLKKSF